MEHLSEEKREAHEDYSPALEQLTDGILIVSGEKIIVYCNAALCRLYNVTKTALLGKECAVLAEKGIVDHSFAELAMTVKKPVTYEQTTKNSTALVSTAVPILSPEGDVSFVAEQVRSLEALEFYAPDSGLAPPAPDSGRKQFRPGAPALAEFKSPVMQDIYKLADNMATKNINILILGASGTGKSQLARRIHGNSARKNGPFMTIDCSTIPDNLIESELFGYQKGAFSGASAQGKLGLVEAADGGTIFLDEIGELPFSLQSKLLQFVQEKTFTPVGSVRPKRVDTRIIAATNKDIPTLIRENRFREDLYYRLSAVTIPMPPLRNRPEDIRLLVRHFSNDFNLKHGTNVSFATEALEILCRYSWPGNIREMEHLIEFLILSCQGDYITPHMLPSNISADMFANHGGGHGNAEKAAGCAGSGWELGAGVRGESGLESVATYGDFMAEQEERLVQALYPRYDTSYKLSERLSVSQSTASRLIRKYIKKKP